MLFSDRSIWTMLHGIVLTGAALAALAAGLFFIYATRPGEGSGGLTPRQERALSRVLLFGAAMLWLVVIAGTYVIFPLYRTPPPQGATDLAMYPRALLLANPQTAWLHAFAMEIKEHVPFIAAMLATAVAFMAMRSPARLVGDPGTRRMGTTLLSLCLVLVAAAGLLGVFINKVAPLE